MSERLLRWAVSGLEGLAALRSKRVLVEVVGISLLIGLVSVVTPWILFPALGLPYGIIDAVLIHIVTTLASAIPVPIPAKLGFFKRPLFSCSINLGWTIPRWLLAMPSCST
ncbi:MAG: hypothetical protein R3E31_23080 [Chloroflexota bacterium]